MLIRFQLKVRNSTMIFDELSILSYGTIVVIFYIKMRKNKH